MHIHFAHHTRPSIRNGKGLDRRHTDIVLSPEFATTAPGLASHFGIGSFWDRPFSWLGGRDVRREPVGGTEK